MGEHAVNRESDDQRLRAFMKALLEDLRALEQMLDAGLIESGVRRVGAEQEMFLVDRGLRPAPVAVEVLKRVGDPRSTRNISCSAPTLRTPLSIRPASSICSSARRSASSVFMKALRRRLSDSRLTACSPISKSQVSSVSRAAYKAASAAVFFRS